MRGQLKCENNVQLSASSEMLAMFTQTVNSLRSFELTVFWGFSKKSS